MVGPPGTSGEARWFATEVQPHESKLRGWLRLQFPRLTDIDDLVQEAFLRLIRARASGKVKNSKTYLFATARNAALDLFRRNRVFAPEPVEKIDELHVLDGGLAGADSLSHAQDLQLLAEAVKALPPGCRNVLVLQKIHGLSYKQIAQRLHISERTVNAQVAKGMLRCRDYLRARRDEKRAL